MVSTALFILAQTAFSGGVRGLLGHLGLMSWAVLVLLAAFSLVSWAIILYKGISLGRALAVRGYLIGEGVARGRIIVRALGAPADGGAPERVDIRWLAQ